MPQEYQSLDNIVLCLSGGGYRAALFHLGAMSYLERLGLLDRVRVLSTVSGGSFPGMLYALYKAQKKPFSEVYQDLIAFTRQNALVRETLKELSLSSNNQDLINLFADFYHNHLLRQSKFEEIWKLGPNEVNHDHYLRNVIFNAIDLVNGLSFRFHYQGKYVNHPQSYSGNYYLRISEEKVKQVRLADILAASSGFPGGFEPLILDKEIIQLDVLHPQVDHEVKAGLMDGGIIDNQGLDAAFRAVVRDEFPEKYSEFIQMDNTEFAKSIVDLLNDENIEKSKSIKSLNIGTKEARSKIIDKYTYIISDVDSYYLRPFRNAEENKNFFTRLNLNWIFILFHIFIIAILGLSVTIFSPLDWGDSFTFASVFTLGIMAVLFFANQIFIKRLFRKVPVVGAEAWPMIRSMPLHKIIYLFKQRIFSLTTVVAGVFLKEIRRNVYKQLFGQDRFRHRRISNLITDLIQKDVTRRQEELKKENIGSHHVFQKIYNPSEKIVSTATRAFNTGTTLWFEEEELKNNKIEDLIGAGQFTMCFNLLEHLCRQFPEADDTHHFYQVLSRARKDWDLFNEDTHFLVKDFKTEPSEPVA